MPSTTLGEKQPPMQIHGYWELAVIIDLNTRVQHSHSPISRHRFLKHNVLPQDQNILRSLEPRITAAESQLSVDSEVEEQQLGEKIRQVDWSQATPEEFAQTVRAAPRVGLLPDAHRLAAQGHLLHPDHKDLAHLAYVFSPPRRTGPPVPASPSTRLNHNWLTTHATEYRNKWVALKSGELVASADSFQDILAQLESSSGIFIARV